MRWAEEDLHAYYRRHPELAPRDPREQHMQQAEDIREGALLTHIRRLAAAHGFLIYHTYSSRKSEPGYPDLTMVKPASPTSPGRLIFAELKSAKGKLTMEQQTWIDMLRHSVPNVEVYIWRPSDMETIIKILGKYPIARR